MKNIKSIIALTSVSALLASCITTTKTAKTAGFDASTYTATVADLDVADQRVTVTLNPVPADVNRGGISNVKKTVEAMALEQNGNADVLVNPEFTYTVERGFFSKKITSMTVTGRPAKYKNFRSLNDSVWSDPVFRGAVVRTGTSRLKGHGLIGKIAGAVGGAASGRRAYGNESAYGNEGQEYRHGFTWGMDFGCAYDFDGEEAVPTASLALGYNIGKYLYLGAGSTFDFNTSSSLYFQPVFGNVRVYFSKSTSAPFLDCRIGYGFEHGDRHVDGGRYISAALGYTFNKFEVSVYWSNQKCERKYDYWYDYYWSYSRDKYFNRLGLRLGFRL